MGLIMGKWYWQDEEKAPPLKPLIVATNDDRLIVVKSKVMDEPYRFQIVDGQNRLSEESIRSEDIRVWAYVRFVPRSKTGSDWQQKKDKEKAERRLKEATEYLEKVNGAVPVLNVEVKS